MSVMQSQLQSLNPPQLEAVSHGEGPLLILAGPGSGKTRVITNRIANLLHQGVPSRQILALTFTNKAAEEMKARLRLEAPGQNVWMGTFHRFCAQLLRVHAQLVGLESNYSIYDVEDSRQLLRETIEQLEIDLSMTSVPAIAAAISSAKNKLLRHDEYRAGLGNPLGALVQQVYPEYQRRLLLANAADFDDLLLHVATVLRENEELRRQLDQHYQHILVDEYQDTNLVQYAIVRALSIDVPNLVVTGDPDQSIYRWRGANIDNILGFEHDYADVRVIRLEQNYRSTSRILQVADQLIAHNHRRKGKSLFTDNPSGVPVRFVQYATAREEADSIAAQIAADLRRGRRTPKDFAVFYRTNALSRQIERALRETAIPYQVVQGVEFYQRKEIKDVLAYLHLINNSNSDAAFLRVINTPPRGIGKKTLQRLSAYAADERIPLFDAARQSGLITTLKGRACVELAAFVALYDRLCLSICEPLATLMQHVLGETEYCDYLRGSGLEEDLERLDNVAELLEDAREFDRQYDGDDRLEQFLERVALVNDTDNWETTTDMVTLMTLHAAKGLEFPVVYIIGLEEGLLPHRRSRDDVEELEEERRLLFVGITRARLELQLSMSTYRTGVGGASAMATGSRFLTELPRHEMDWHAMRPAADYPVDEFHAEPDVVDYHDPDRDAGEWPADQPARDDDPIPTESGRVAAAAARPKLMTAAQLDGHRQPAERVDPDQFRQGMLVTHPQYGMGKIVELSGKGERRRAIVKFFADPEPHTFVLHHSELHPLAAKSDGSA